MGDSYDRTDEMPCPRCHEQCGWCSDPRWMHGTLRLPGTRRKCDIPAMAPEGDDCPVCGGAKRVTRHIRFERLTPERPS